MLFPPSSRSLALSRFSPGFDEPQSIQLERTGPCYQVAPWTPITEHNIASHTWSAHDVQLVLPFPPQAYRLGRQDLDHRWIQRQVGRQGVQRLGHQERRTWASYASGRGESRGCRVFKGYELGWGWRAESWLKGKDGSREFGVWSRKFRAGNHVKEVESSTESSPQKKTAETVQTTPSRTSDLSFLSHLPGFYRKPQRALVQLD